jgi:hypothetical protein
MALLPWEKCRKPGSQLFADLPGQQFNPEIFRMTQNFR